MNKPLSYNLPERRYSLLGWSGRREFNLINKIASFEKSQRILDVGGGKGSLAKRLIDLVKEVVIIDPSKQMLEKVKNPKITGILGEANHLPFKNAEFDMIYAADAFHHFTNA